MTVEEAQFLVRKKRNEDDHEKEGEDGAIGGIDTKPGNQAIQDKWVKTHRGCYDIMEGRGGRL